MKTKVSLPIGVLVLFSAMAAFASDSVRVAEQVSPVGDKPYMIQEFFKVDEDDAKSTRAWVEIQVTGDYWDAEQHRQEVKVERQVTGLSYNPRTKAILYQAQPGKSPVVCGTFVKGGFFSESRVTASGHCVFSEKVENRKIDDGYHSRSEPYMIVDLAFKP